MKKNIKKHERHVFRGADSMCFSGSGPTHFLRWIVYYCVCIQHDIDKSQISFIELCKTLRTNSGLRAINSCLHLFWPHLCNRNICAVSYVLRLWSLDPYLRLCMCYVSDVELLSLFSFRIHYIHFPDCLLLLLSISVFYFFFCFYTFLVVGSVR